MKDILISKKLNIICMYKIAYIKFKYKYLRDFWHKKTNNYKINNHKEFILVWIVVWWVNINMDECNINRTYNSLKIIIFILSK